MVETEQEVPHKSVESELEKAKGEVAEAANPLLNRDEKRKANRRYYKVFKEDRTTEVITLSTVSSYDYRGEVYKDITLWSSPAGST